MAQLAWVWGSGCYHGYPITTRLLNRLKINFELGDGPQQWHSRPLLLLLRISILDFIIIIVIEAQRAFLASTQITQFRTQLLDWHDILDIA